MPLMESLRQLDKRVLGPPDDDYKKGVRVLPVYLAVALLLQAVAVLANVEIFQWAVLFLIVLSLRLIRPLTWWRKHS